MTDTIPRQRLDLSGYVNNDYDVRQGERWPCHICELDISLKFLTLLGQGCYQCTFPLQCLLWRHFILFGVTYEYFPLPLNYNATKNRLLILSNEKRVDNVLDIGIYM